MKPIPMRVQLGLVLAGYAAVLVLAAALVWMRYLQYVHHPEDVMASGGMHAAGDWLLEMFIVGLFLVPTFFLALIARKSESLSTGYAKVMLGLSLTAPICLGVFSIPAVSQSTMLLGWVCGERLFASPILVVWLGISRLLGRFPRAKRMGSYALLIEAMTLVLMVAMLFLSARAR